MKLKKTALAIALTLLTTSLTGGFPDVLGVSYSSQAIAQLVRLTRSVIQLCQG